MRRLCAWCHRDLETGALLDEAEYSTASLGASHGMCPECYKKEMGEMPMENKDLALMQNPSQWPHHVLPVKKKAPPGKIPDELGIILGDKPIVYFCNMFRIPNDLSRCPRHAYKSYEELIADGWIVD